jgi:hypothetical protein
MYTSIVPVLWFKQIYILLVYSIVVSIVIGIVEMLLLEEEDLVQLLQEHGPLKTKTIEDLRLTLMTVAVYHHLNM